MLGEAPDDAKVIRNRRLAYQVPEVDGDPCGRTFEDAFILANRLLFGLAGDTREQLEIDAREIAGDEKKSDFALTYAIRETGWNTPRYIAEGLRWLASGNVAALDPGLELVAKASASTVSEPIELDAA